MSKWHILGIGAIVGVIVTIAAGYFLLGAVLGVGTTAGDVTEHIDNLGERARQSEQEARRATSDARNLREELSRAEKYIVRAEGTISELGAGYRQLEATVDELTGHLSEATEQGGDVAQSISRARDGIRRAIELVRGIPPPGTGADN